MEVIQEFLRTQRTDLATIIRQLENFQVSVAEASNVIQIMTIHQSKGLGFEIVILPELANRSLIDATRYTEVMVENEHGVSFQTPPVKWARPLFPSILEHEEAWKQDQYYESFCLLYVAMTRAKRGLYCMLDIPEKTRPEDGLGAWITDALEQTGLGDESVLYCDGDSDWVAEIEVVNVDASEDLQTKEVALPLKRGRSAGGRQVIQRTAFADRSALDQGTMVHEVLECIDWLPPLPVPLPDDLITVFGSLPGREKYITKLNEPEIRELFVKPDKNANLFREQALEWIGKDSLWNTVRLDRFVVCYDDNGEVSEIQLIDFKTDVSDGLEQKYSHQLNHYESGLRAVYGDVRIESYLLQL